MSTNRQADEQNEARRPDAGAAAGPDGGDFSIELTEQQMIDQLQREMNELQDRMNEAQDRWKRAAADLENFRRRALQNEQQARREGAAAVLLSIVPVLDNFDVALAMEPPDEASRQVMEGVKVIHAALIRALETQGVSLITPRPGDEFDPNRHEAMMKHAAEGVKPGRISMVMQNGYMLDERVVRPAKVAVAPGKED